MTIEFTIPGAPQGKERPRFTKNGIAYTPQKTRDYEKLVAWAYHCEAHGAKFTGPIFAEIAAVTDLTICKRYGTRPCVVVRLTGEEAPHDTM